MLKVAILVACQEGTAGLGPGDGFDRIKGIEDARGHREGCAADSELGQAIVNGAGVGHQPALVDAIPRRASWAPSKFSCARCPSLRVNGTGLSTLRERLKLAFGTEAALRLYTNDPHRFCAKIELPAERMVL